MRFLDADGRPSRRECVGVGLALAGVSLTILALFRHGDNGARYDFDLFYTAARALRAGKNPYEVIGPGRAFDNITPFYYPLPAIVLLMPLAWLTRTAAHATFVGASAFLLGYGLARHRQPWLFAMVLSQSFIGTVAAGQWSILLLAAFFLPTVRAVAGAKPQVGLAIIGATQHRRELMPVVVGTTLLTALAFVLRPHWLGEWRSVLGEMPIYRAAITYPGGALALLAFLRWRRPEARYFAFLACLPQAPGFYTDLLLFAVPRTRWQVLGLALLSHVAYAIFLMLPVAPTGAERIVRYGFVSIPLLLLPCLVMLLWRPNEGALPAWLERATLRLPRWLRGRPTQFERPDYLSRVAGPTRL